MTDINVYHVRGWFPSRQSWLYCWKERSMGLVTYVTRNASLSSYPWYYQQELNTAIHRNVFTGKIKCSYFFPVVAKVSAKAEISTRHVVIAHCIIKMSSELKTKIKKKIKTRPWAGLCKIVAKILHHQNISKNTISSKITWGN